MPSEFRPLSLPLLAHVFGDAFPREAEHETACLKDLFQYVVSFLEGLVINPQPLSQWFHVDRLQWILKSLEYSLQIENRMHDRWRRLAVMRDEAEAQMVLEEAKHDLYIHLYQLLQIEGNALIAGGWTRKLRGHDMLYEFRKEGCDKYTFRVFNSFNSGSVHQLFPLKGQKLEHRGILEMTNLRLKDVLNSRFLKSLIEIHLCIQLPSEKIIGYLDTAYSEKDIYNGLLSLLDGSLSREEQMLEEIVSPSEKGTGAWKSLCAWFRKNLSYEEYHRLIYTIRYESLKQYVGQNGDFIHSDDCTKQTEELACIKAIAHVLAADVQKSSFLSISDRENAHSFLTFLFYSIQKNELIIQNEIREETTHLDLLSPIDPHSFKRPLPGDLGHKRELLASLQNKSELQNVHKLPLPRAILVHPDFYVLFDEEIQVQQIDPFTYWFIDEGLPNYIRLTLFGGIIIQRFFNELGWYQFVPSSMLLREAPSDAGEEHQYTTPLGTRAIVDGCTHWISLSAEEDMIICRIPEKIPSYSVKMKFGELGLEVRNIYRIPKYENERKSKIVPIEHTEKRFLSLIKFEDPSFFCVWTDLNNMIDLIEFLRFNLHFDVKTEHGFTRAFSREFSGFYLDGKQPIKILKKFFNYLVLTNDNKEQKILIPRHPIKEQKALIREQKVVLDKSLGWHQNAQRYFVYDLTEEGILRAEDLEAYLYLGILFLASRQYKMAIYYFHHFCQKTSSYTKSEKELLEWGIKLSEKNSDYHIHAFSLRLYLAWLKFHNAEIYSDIEAYPSESRNYWFRLAAQLSEYAEKPPQTSNLALDPDKEIFLLRKILLYVPSEVLMKRLSKLTQETSSPQNLTEQNPELIERKALIASKLPSSLTTLASTTPRAPILFTRPGWAFMERFMHNYAVILLPEHEDKEKLRQQLIFIHNDPHPEIRLLGRILEETAKHPEKFPSIEEMYAILHSDNTTAFRKNVVIPTLQLSFFGERRRKKKKSKRI